MNAGMDVQAILRSLGSWERCCNRFKLVSFADKHTYKGWGTIPYLISFLVFCAFVPLNYCLLCT